MTDSSIYHDLYAVWGQIQIWWMEVEPTLTSHIAIRIYVALAGLIILGLSIWLAYHFMARLKKVEEDAFTLKPRGRKPVRPEAIERARERLLAFRKKMWRDYFMVLAVFVVYGFIIPSIGLYLTGAYYSWIDPSEMPFVSLHDSNIVSTPQWTDLMRFVGNQLSHGTLMDLLEVFHKDFGALTNNPANYPFSITVFLYRSFVGTFAIALLFFVRRAIIIAWRIPSARELLPSVEN